MNTIPSFNLHNFKQKRQWTAVHMPRVRQAQARLPAALNGVRLACSMHLDIKMIPFVEDLLARAAAVHLTTCNPATVRDDVVAYLVNKGPTAYAWRDMSATACNEAIRRAVAW